MRSPEEQVTLTGWRRALSLLRGWHLVLLIVLPLGVAATRAYLGSWHSLRPPRVVVERPPSIGGRPYREVSFPSKESSVLLKGWYVPGTLPAAIVLGHGQGASRAQMLPEANLLAARGFGVLTFDYRAHGESGGDQVTRGDKERLDLLGALDFLSAQPEVKIIGALGFSRGATVACEVAGTDQRIAAVILEACSTSVIAAVEFDYRRWGFLSIYPALLATWAAGIDMHDVNPANEIGLIAPRPVMIIHGTKDVDKPTWMARALFLHAKAPKELWIIEGATHGHYEKSAPGEYERRVLEFFENNLLKPSAATGSEAPSNPVPGGVLDKAEGQ